MKNLSGSSKRTQAALELLRRQRARHSLACFTEYTYPQYLSEAFHRRLANALDDVVEGRIRRLMVFAPPQHGKSELISVRLPAYWLGRRPEDPLILASYAASLAERHSRHARTVVEGPEFEKLFPGVRTRRDSRAVNQWELDKHRGGMLAVGVGGPVTGHGAMLGIVDDPVENWQAAQSAVMRENVWQWYRSTFRTRIWENGAIIVVMTRWHEDDLAGRLLKDQPGEWTVLRFPALAETQAERDATAQRQGLLVDEPDLLGREQGEALSPQRFSEEELNRVKGEVGLTIFDAEYQGAPTKPEGVLFKKAWFRYAEDAPPGLLYECVIWDTAFEEKKESDYSAATWIGLARDKTLYLRPLLNEKLEFPALVTTALQIIKDKKRIEQAVEGKASGKSLRQVLRASGAPMIEFQPDGDKIARATSVTPYFETGMVYFLPSPYLEALEGQLLKFPRDAHDDLVDTVAYGILRCVARGRTRTGHAW